MGVVPVKKPPKVIDSAKAAAGQASATPPSPVPKTPEYGNVVTGLSRKTKV